MASRKGAGQVEWLCEEYYVHQSKAVDRPPAGNELDQ